MFIVSRTSLKKYKLKGKRILVWKQQSMKPSSVPFQARSPVQLHYSYALEALPSKERVMTPNVRPLQASPEIGPWGWDYCRTHWGNCGSYQM